MSIVKDFISSVRKAVSPEKDPVQEIQKAVNTISNSLLYRYDEFEDQTYRQRRADEKAERVIKGKIQAAFEKDPRATLIAVCSLSNCEWEVDGLNQKIAQLLDTHEKIDPVFVTLQRERWISNADKSYYGYSEYGNLGEEQVMRQRVCIKQRQETYTL